MITGRVDASVVQLHLHLLLPGVSKGFGDDGGALCWGTGVEYIQLARGRTEEGSVCEERHEV